RTSAYVNVSYVILCIGSSSTQIYSFPTRRSSDLFKPKGAFYVFPDISAHLNKKTPDGSIIENSTDLCLYLIQDHGLATVPGDAFGEPNGIRLSYASGMDQLKEGMKRLKEGLAALAT